ncbi:type 1 glutamine amidotransferase-like domain-containing protein [Candidatus Peregrinibacteria bacterium]|jgi:dipeptidase E|nr:type 1 glutamine amidotransferase-like domain-containing protein [Candidatus Peregrinibacteria bacterium]MBT3598943.1 type 1 glutamine amidotransferase-like domain-containing protein [Candidatus Peregrinibacteria bacterium]MBT6731103.1 type 1 glutamine amidotransferase-like domain-containing protein [Candidatus Peregrinibacteria bacterium]MBT7009767.1 type 1 glutamine amidotransferase-like domain-containing protein [Candidatus Peregrinibacteria bacterium]MBT7344805.1 type 1 glutamine amidotr
MKLFLSSKNINNEQLPYFKALVGKELGSIRFALIENASDLHKEENKGFVYDTRSALMNLGMQIELIDIHEYINNGDAIVGKLKDFDVIWIGGGNTYYIRYLLKITELDKHLKELIQSGIVYGGGSAGAIVAGPTIKTFHEADSPTYEMIDSGLHLCDFVVIPHWDDADFKDRANSIKQYYDTTDYKTILLNDDQAIVVENSICKIIP